MRKMQWEKTDASREADSRREHDVNESVFI